MRITPRWIGLAAMAGALSVATTKSSYACGNSTWRLSSNSLSCVQVEPSSNFSVFLTNSCMASLHVANRNAQSTGTLAVDLEAAKKFELLLPAPAHAGDTAIFDGTASTQAGELRFAFTGPDDCAGCNISRPQRTSWPAWLGLSGLVGLAVLFRRAKRAQ